MEFNLVQLAITVRTANVQLLRRHLQMLSGSFADICRDLVCNRPAGVCDSCSRQDSCPWFQVFGQKLTSDPAELKRHQKPSLPFVFSFPQMPDTVHNTEVQCGLLVVGPAITHVGMLLAGFDGFLTRDPCPGPAEVTFVGSLDYQGTVQPLGDGNGIRYHQNMVVLSAVDLLEAHACGGGSLHIRLISPLRLFDNGRLLDRFDFSRFARSVMRRVTSLAYYYGGYEFTCDYKSLSDQADAVVCTEGHFSILSGAGQKKSGFTGQGRFHGDFCGLMPFLVLGSYVHAGKGASYGMGRYELSCGTGV